MVSGVSVQRTEVRGSELLIWDIGFVIYERKVVDFIF